MYTAYSHEAMQRLRQFEFSAAVLTWQVGAENVAAELEDHKVPFFIFGVPQAGSAAIAGQPLVVTDLDAVVPTLANVLKG